MAAAIGAGLPVQRTPGSMVVISAAATTEVAFSRWAGIVYFAHRHKEFRWRQDGLVRSIANISRSGRPEICCS